MPRSALLTKGEVEEGLIEPEDVYDEYAEFLERLLYSMHLSIYALPDGLTTDGDLTNDIFLLDPVHRIWGIRGLFFVHPYMWDFPVEYKYKKGEVDYIPNAFFYVENMKITWYKYATLGIKVSKREYEMPFDEDLISEVYNKIWESAVKMYEKVRKCQ